MPITPVTGVITAEAQESFTGQPCFQASQAPGLDWDQSSPGVGPSITGRAGRRSGRASELGREPLARRDVEPRYRVRRVLGAVAVGDGAIGVPVRIIVRVGRGGVVAVGFTGWLDPHVGVQVGEGGVWVGPGEGPRTALFWLHQSPRK